MIYRRDVVRMSREMKTFKSTTESVEVDRALMEVLEEMIY